jgi:hypothetical protein
MRRSPADRPVVAVNPLLSGCEGGAKGPAHQDLFISFNRAALVREEARRA